MAPIANTLLGNAKPLKRKVRAMVKTIIMITDSTVEKNISVKFFLFKSYKPYI
jgi:hypothetical protein